ncbi:MAG TPA: hypothetical protein VJU14_10885 [Solirubrobacterales bacterium]|nr:hypothetical protein [Solirubrobacterales bacterium]
MTGTAATFHGGPADGRELGGRSARWPRYVRVAQAADGTVEVLATAADAPPDDQVSVYERVGASTYRHLPEVRGARDAEGWRRQATELYRGPAVPLDGMR